MRRIDEAQTESAAGNTRSENGTHTCARVHTQGTRPDIYSRCVAHARLTPLLFEVSILCFRRGIFSASPQWATILSNIFNKKVPNKKKQTNSVVEKDNNAGQFTN